MLPVAQIGEAKLHSLLAELAELADGGLGAALPTALA